jgi:hypothetical protein
MYDAGKIIIGIVLFLVLITFPFWFTLALGNPDYRPDPELPAGQVQCVESKEYMVHWHMDLLNQWRDSVVRQGNRMYVSSEYGERHEMSLTRTCMRCHNSKEKFCDRCHDYTAVDPYCWDCHVEPKGE